MLHFKLARCESLSRTIRVRELLATFAFFICVFAGQNTHAQTSAFSYQGTLAEGGVPANGSYEMQFKLFDSLAGPTQIGSTLTRNPVAVTNGGFAVVLDFGSSAFPGPDRFLAIAVRNLSGGVLTTLSPRSQLFSSPYSIRSKTVTGPIMGTSPTATLTVTNDQPGIQDPSPKNPPPAALRGEATATNDSNIGVMGIANGTKGVGVAGFTNGNGGTPGQADAIGVLGLALSPTGQTIGVSSDVESPDGTAFEAFVSGGGSGYLFNGSSGSTTQFSVTSAGDTYINGSLSVVGTISLGDPVSTGMTPVCRDAQSRLANCSSSLRYKTDVVPFGLGVDLVKRLRPITFNWKDGGTHDLGLGAEDVAEVELLLVTHNKDGQIEGVKYDRIGVVLINAVKEQQTQIESQQKQIDEQKGAIKRQQAEIDALKAHICVQSPAAAFCKPGN